MNERNENGRGEDLSNADALARKIAAGIEDSVKEALCALEGRAGRIVYTVHVAPGHRAATVEVPRSVMVSLG